jgi:hypothetical protein
MELFWQVVFSPIVDVVFIVLLSLAALYFYREGNKQQSDYFKLVYLLVVVACLIFILFHIGYLVRPYIIINLRI